MSLSNITGYQTIRQRLSELVATQRIPQVSLILGSDSSPLLLFARSLATYLHCPQKSEQAACGHCPSCQKCLKTLHPDLYYLFPIGNTSKAKSSKKSLLSDVMPLWRTFLDRPYQSLPTWASHLGDHAKQLHITAAQVEESIAFVRTHPLESQHKVVIIYLPENMSITAANKLLKTLEEPPSHTYFILVSNDRDAILPTVSSRTFPLTVPSFQDEDLLQILQERYPNTPTNKLQQVTKLAKGDLMLAFDLTTEKDEHLFERIADWLRSLYARQYAPIVELAEDFSKMPPTQQKAWIRYVLRLMHTTLTVQSVQDVGSLIQAQSTFCEKLGKTLSFAQLEALITEIEKMHMKLSRNAHPKLLFLATSLTLENIMSK
ncbi:MAG: hypothetical protein AAF335_02265 [Bacteroidota bacterium]